jgi:hypothetical protein
MGEHEEIYDQVQWLAAKIERMEGAMKTLAIFAANNRAYISQLRGEGDFAENAGEEVDALTERIDRKINPQNWK